MAIAKVRPLGKIGLAEEHDTCITQPRNDERVLSCRLASERERTGGCLHAVGGRDIVFNKDRDAVERTAKLARFPLGVEAIGIAPGLRIELDDAVQRRALMIEGFDAREVFLDKRAGRVLPARQAALQIGYGQFFEIKCRGSGLAGRPRCSRRRRWIRARGGDQRRGAECQQKFRHGN